MCFKLCPSFIFALSNAFQNFPQIMSAMDAYLRATEAAWDNYDVTRLSALISMQDAHVRSLSRARMSNVNEAVKEVFDAPMSDVVIEHLNTISSAANDNFTEAYQHQVAAVQHFCKLLSSQKDDNWPLPMMYSLCLDLRRMANAADIEQSHTKGFKPGTTLQKAAEHIMACFRICALDSKSSEEVTKRWGMLYIVNQLFKIYFKVNKQHLCKPLIRAIDSSSLRDKYPLSQRVTYKYYVGRKLMMDSTTALKEAEAQLGFAFEHCHRSSRKNKRTILMYLIPVKMLLGHMPTQALLHKYDLDQFSEVLSAVKAGNLLRLNEAMEANEKFFVDNGIYLILEKLKIITYRNLFKKVAAVMGTHQIPVEAFLVALRMMRVEDIDQDETQCILANLIFEGRIKGYISYQHQKLVVSKQQPFPALASVAS